MTKKKILFLSSKGDFFPVHFYAWASENFSIEFGCDRAPSMVDFYQDVQQYLGKTVHFIDDVDNFKRLSTYLEENETDFILVYGPYPKITKNILDEYSDKLFFMKDSVTFNDDTIAKLSISKNQEFEDVICNISYEVLEIDKDKLPEFCSLASSCFLAEFLKIQGEFFSLEELSSKLMSPTLLINGKANGRTMMKLGLVKCL